MTEIDSTDSSTGRRRLFVCAIVASQATIGTAVAFVLGDPTLSPSIPWREPRLDRGVGGRCGPSPSDDVVPRQRIRIPGRIGLPFPAARKDAGRMRSKDQCVAFQL
jgi:hypothetical protein